VQGRKLLPKFANKTVEASCRRKTSTTIEVK
jgi:hypothetical protein